MSQFKYILQPYNGPESRYICPGCQNRKKTFSLYIDLETGHQIGSFVGRCNREINCGYHYTPRQFFQDNPVIEQYPINFHPSKNVTKRYKKLSPGKVSFISTESLRSSLNSYDGNYFIKFLQRRFGPESTEKLICKYFIGSSKHWSGSTVFWQIDISGNIRTGKIMLYNQESGKRVKEPLNYINWVHKVLNLPEFELNQCLFGEHLLKDLTKPVAIVESEKTAIIASVYLPQFIWLATGSLSNLTIEKFQVLKGRSIVLFPDIQAYERWKLKAKELASICSVHVSELLEKKSSQLEKAQGLDLADFLLKYSIEDFRDIIKDNKHSKNDLIEAGCKKDTFNLNAFTAFVDIYGKLWIETPLAKTYSVYPSISDYNKRSTFPDFISATEININEMNPVEIDLHTLIIKSYKNE